MGRNYLGCRVNISTGQIMLFCSYGEIFSRLPGKIWLLLKQGMGNRGKESGNGE